MPRFLRVFLTCSAFAIFFSLSCVLGAVWFPLLFLLGLGNLEAHRRRCTRFCGWGYGTFIFFIRLIGLVGTKRAPQMPPELKGKSYVLIANHPTFIDLLFLLNAFPGSTCVVKSSWYQSFAFGMLLRSTHYVPGPGYPGDYDSDEDFESKVLERMCEHVDSGHPLLIFPEGTRSSERSLKRFKRGAFEIAKKTGVPIVPVFIKCDRPFLMKGVPFWKVPDHRAAFDFEVLPIIDTASDERCARDIRDDLHAEFRMRYTAWVAERERLGLLSAPAEATS